MAERAAIAGLGTGELFGFHFEQLAILEPITESLPFVGLLSVSELTFEQVVKILEVSIAIGIVHLLLAFFLRLHADIKQTQQEDGTLSRYPDNHTVSGGGVFDTSSHRIGL